MATKLDSVQIGQKVKFSIYGNIGSLKTFEGELASKIAGRHLPPNSQADINHVNIYPTLPETTKAIVEDKYSAYQYLMIVLSDGSTYYIGVPWVIDNTMKVIKPRVARPEITNFTDSDASRLRNILEQNGYTVNSIAISE